MAKDKEKEKCMACCQELIDSTFSFMKAYNHGTDFQKTTTRKRFKKAFDKVNEVVLSAKVLPMKPKRLPAYTVSSGSEFKMVTIINKE